MGSGCSSVGRVVTSNPRGLRFKSNHWPNFVMEFTNLLLTVEKAEINNEEAGDGHNHETYNC